MFYDKIFIKRDLKAFFNEMVYNYNCDCMIVRSANIDMAIANTKLVGISCALMRDSGEGIKILSYYIEPEITKKDGVSIINGYVAKLNGCKVVGEEKFTCEISDYDFKINSKLIKHDNISSVWRKHIFLHLNEEDKKAYKTKLIDDELKM